MTQIMDYSYLDRLTIAVNIVKSGDFEDYYYDNVLSGADKAIEKRVKSAWSQYRDTLTYNIPEIGNRMYLDEKGNVYCYCELYMHNKKNYTSDNPRDTKAGDYAYAATVKFDEKGVWVINSEKQIAESDFIERDSKHLYNLYPRYEPLNWYTVRQMDDEMIALVEAVEEVISEYNEKAQLAFDPRDQIDVIEWADAQKLDVSGYI